MSKDNIFEFKDLDTIADILTQMLRCGSQQLIYQAARIKQEDLLAVNAHRLTPPGNATVVLDGYQPQLEILIGIGSVTVKLPRIRQRKEGSQINTGSS